MNNKLKYTLRAIVSISILAYLVSSLDWEAVSVLRPELLLVILAGAGIFFLAQCTLSLRWKLLLDRIVTGSVSYLYLVRTYTIAQFFNLLMPGSIGGDVVRATSAAASYNISRKTSFTVVISERLFGLAAIAVMVATGLLIYPMFAKDIGLDEYLAFAAVAGAIIAFFVAKRLACRSSMIPMSVALALLLISVTAQLADVLITLFLARYFELEIGFTELLIVIPVVYFVTILPISLGGLGVREGAMVALLASFDVGETTAIIIALSLYLTKFIVGLIGGLIYLGGGRKVAE